MSHIPRLQGNRFDVQRFKHLHGMGLSNKIIGIRMGVTKHIIGYWIKRLNLKGNRGE